MIQNETYLVAADNSGAKVLRVIRVLGGTHKQFGSIGDIIVCSVREAVPNTDVKKGDIVKAVVARTKETDEQMEATSDSMTTLQLYLTNSINQKAHVSSGQLQEN